jgi:hypothetical protein
MPPKIHIPKSKEKKIEKVKANLPLPEEPPVPSDWQSFDQRVTGRGSGSISADEKHSTVGLREPATQPEEEVDFNQIGWNVPKLAKPVTEPVGEVGRHVGNPKAMEKNDTLP